MPAQGERHPEHPDLFWSTFYGRWRIDRNGHYKIDRELKRAHRWTAKVHASDLAAALADEEEMARQDPTSPKPRYMLERLRIVGEDRLTATDNALYEALLATARRAGLDQGKQYELDGDVARAYLGASRWIDVRRSVDRLVDTKVTFSVRTETFREAGTVPMLIAHTREGIGPMRGRNSIRFEFPSILSTVMYAARLYGRVELKAFPKFTSKYAGRLYGLAASYASRGRFSMSPAKLAEALGWTADRFHFGSFEQRCLKPALDDIAAHVTRISVSYETVRGGGRGRPVEKVAFTIAELVPQRFDETKTVRMNREDYFAIKRKDAVHSPELIPSARLVGRAIRKHWVGRRRWVSRELDAFRAKPLHLIAWAWREALDEARFGTSPLLRNQSATNRLAGRALLAAIDRDGLEAVFQRWVDEEIASPRCLTLATGRMGPNGAAYLAERSKTVPSLAPIFAGGGKAVDPTAPKLATPPIPRSNVIDVLLNSADDDDDIRIGADFGDLEEPDFDSMPFGDDEPHHDDDIAF